MKRFIIILIGQIISILGSQMTRFALGIWLWQETGKATDLAIVVAVSMAPRILLYPIAGVIVDKFSRRLTIILSDLAAGIVTVILFLLLVRGELVTWHLVVGNFISSAFSSFQFPAFSAAISLMVPKDEYVRANSMLSIVRSGAGILAPALAGVLLGLIQLEGIMLFDIISFLAAIGTLLIVSIPEPETSEAGRGVKSGLWHQFTFGFRYILSRPSLFGMQLIGFLDNLAFNFSYVLITPLILARNGENEAILGTVLSVGSAGTLIGGLILSAWKGPKRRVHFVLWGIILGSLLGTIWFGLFTGVLFWSFANFVLGMSFPMVGNSNQAIWQAKVPPDIQGRVFTTRLFIAQISAPLATLFSGSIADNIFGPAMMSETALSNIFGKLVGTGPSAGMALMFLFSGILGAFAGVLGYLLPVVRNIEDILPDHIQAQE
ncbi:MAG: MFS transporter [Anaerolineales bacterium]|nr:MFS transporter [Anaerolineales bacterium]